MTIKEKIIKWHKKLLEKYFPIKFEECPYCGRPDLQEDKNGTWICLSCFEQWNDEGIL